MSDLFQAELTDEEKAYEANPDGDAPEAPQPEAAAVEAAVEEAETPAAPSEEAPAADPEPEAPRTVEAEVYDNVRKGLDSERMRRKEAEKEAQQMRERIARLEGRMQGYGLDEGEGEAEEVDPLDRVAQEQQQLKEQLEQMQLRNDLNMQEAGFAERTPDYNDAKNHYIETVKGMYQARGYEDNEVNEALGRDIFDLVDRARNNQQNPAELLYKAAKTLGFKSKASEGTEKIARIEEVQQSAPPDVSGAAPRGELTIEQAAEMSEMELAQLTPEQERAMWGG